MTNLPPETLKLLGDQDWKEGSGISEKRKHVIFVEDEKDCEEFQSFLIQFLLDFNNSSFITQ
jgi:hypothetical protein